MTNSCCVYNCKNSEKKEKKKQNENPSYEKKSFHRIPILRKKAEEEIRCFSEERRRLWLSRLNLVRPINDDTIAYICSDHFQSGKPAALFERSHPDWAPNLNLGYDASLPSVDRYKRRLERSCQNIQLPLTTTETATTTTATTTVSTTTTISVATTPSSPLQLLPEAAIPTITMVNDDIDFNTVRYASVHTQTEESTDDNTDYVEVEERNKFLVNENHNLTEKILQILPLNLVTIQGDADRVLFFTGLPNHQILLYLYEFLEESIHSTHRNSLSKFQEFTLTLMRLRLNLNFQDLAYRFGISRSTASRIFEKWITVMNEELDFLIKWPTREELQKTMPRDFVKTFGHKVVAVIDCFEVFIDKPGNPVAQSIT